MDQALSRLVKAGKLLRVARGSYTAPVSSRFGCRAPAPRSVVEALAARTGEAVVAHGAASYVGVWYEWEQLWVYQHTLGVHSSMVGAPHHVHAKRE